MLHPTPDLPKSFPCFGRPFGQPSRRWRPPALLLTTSTVRSMNGSAAFRRAAQIKRGVQRAANGAVNKAGNGVRWMAMAGACNGLSILYIRARARAVACARAQARARARTRAHPRVHAPAAERRSDTEVAGWRAGKRRRESQGGVDSHGVFTDSSGKRCAKNPLECFLRTPGREPRAPLAVCRHVVATWRSLRARASAAF